MANTKKKFYYVLVITNDGPIFVTKVNNRDKMAEWNKLEKPLALDKAAAENLTFGLMANLYTAFTVCLPIEWDSQPYLYSKGYFEWKWNEDNEDNEDKGDE